MARLLAVTALTVLLAASRADVYGKPLKGLTPVPIASVLGEPARYAARAVRIEGSADVKNGNLKLAEGKDALSIETEGFTVPQNVAGARVAAEGRVRIVEGAPPVFVATGLEVTR